MEEWININGFDGIYQISSFGRVRNTKTNKILKCIEHRDEKYLKISITYKKKVHTFWINRLVLTHFKPNEFAKNFQAHHIDFNRQNNRLDNLMWVTQNENNKMKISVHRRQKESYFLYKKLYKKYGEEILLTKLKQIL
jgi:hypothetical protein